MNLNTGFKVSEADMIALLANLKLRLPKFVGHDYRIQVSGS